MAATAIAPMTKARSFTTDPHAPRTSKMKPQSSAISIMESPMMLRTSTRVSRLRRPSPGDEELLQAEEESEGEDFRAAANHGASDFAWSQVLADEFVGDQRDETPARKRKSGAATCPGFASL